MGIIKVTKSLLFLKETIDLSRGAFPYGVGIRDNNKSALVIYPTNDLFLFDGQMKAIKAISGNQRLNLITFSDETHIPDITDAAFSFDYPDDFAEYNSLFLYSSCMIFPDDNSWICLIDETFDFGVGILIAKDEILRDFSKYYDSRGDFENLRKELERINPKKSDFLIENLKKIVLKP